MDMLNDEFVVNADNIFKTYEIILFLIIFEIRISIIRFVS